MQYLKNKTLHAERHLSLSHHPKRQPHLSIDVGWCTVEYQAVKDAPLPKTRSQNYLEHSTDSTISI